VKIRLLSYNIHRAIGLDRRFKPERIEEIIHDHQPDIVILQEVDEGVPRSRELAMAKEIAGNLGYPHFAMGHNVCLRKGYYGNATLSRFPITRQRNIDLTIDNKKKRGCQHTTILLEDGSGFSRALDVFNVHLGLSALERQKQASLLLRSAEFSQLDKNAPCIIGGDFNDWLSRLRALFVVAMKLNCATDQKTKKGLSSIKTYPSFSPRGGLDRIYYRGQLRLDSVQKCRHQVARVASDHLPIFADFTLP
jgi:endonuclease/exonuclease/phosphatase family metal-dependent hydrolase